MAGLSRRTGISGSTPVLEHREAPVAAESIPASQAVAHMTADTSNLKPCVDPRVMKSMQRLRVILAGAPSKSLCIELDAHLKEAHNGIRRLQKQANRAVRDGKGSTVWTGQVYAIALEYQELRDYAEEWQHHANLKAKETPASREMSFEDGAVDTPSFALRESLALQEKATWKANMTAMKRHPSEPALRTSSRSEADSLITSVDPDSHLWVGRVNEESRHRPVELAMYDLSRGFVKWVPAALLDGHKFEALWHTGVRVFGFEFWFGGDIIQAIPDVMPFGDPVRIVRLGMTQRKYKELRRFIRDELAVVYTRQSYDALRQNCNHFSNEVVRFLLHGKQIPEEVRTQLEWCRNAALVKALRPMLNRWLGGMPDKPANPQYPMGGDLGLAPGAYPIVHPSLSPKLLYDERFCSSPTSTAVAFSSSEDQEHHSIGRGAKQAARSRMEAAEAACSAAELHMPMEL
mmetsp:Transcript_111755/g.193695  ORF Transcript_111755/g.193695 Transcript_111755/m.193695 type:complete len:461 (-) Transcript_111755:25-1407(-)